MGACQGLEAVAGPPDRHQPAGAGGIPFDLAAESADVFGHGVGVLPVGGGLPHVGQQLRPRHDLAGLRGQPDQQVELPGRGLHRRALDEDLPLRHLDDE